MNNKDFDSLLDRRLQLTREVLASKSAEYASDSDKLHNFKRAGAIDGVTPIQALRGFDLKHRTSVSDIVDASVRGELPTREKLDEEIGDCINYLILMEALFVEAVERP